jgi:hypothetical protein
VLRIARNSAQPAQSDSGDLPNKRLSCPKTPSWMRAEWTARLLLGKSRRNSVLPSTSGFRAALLPGRRGANPKRVPRPRRDR